MGRIDIFFFITYYVNTPLLCKLDFSLISGLNYVEYFINLDSWEEQNLIIHIISFDIRTPIAQQQGSTVDKS